MTDLPTPPAEWAPADPEGGQTLKSPVRPPGGGASLVGQMLGEYEVEAHLGAGGMGIVYRGVQPQIGKRVAIKVLRPEIASGEESVQALLAEARAVNAIRHSGIVADARNGPTRVLGGLRNLVDFAEIEYRHVLPLPMFSGGAVWTHAAHFVDDLFRDP